MLLIASLCAFVKQDEGEGGFGVRIAQRLTEAASWRLAAELVRRHPELEVRNFFWRIPGAGPPGRYVLLLESRSTGQHFHIDLMSANGATHLLEDFASFLSVSDVRTIVEELETYFELGSPASTPVTTSQAIGFRLVAEGLIRRLFERQALTALPGSFDYSWGDAWIAPGLEKARAVLGDSRFLWNVVAFDAADTLNVPAHYEEIRRPTGYRSGPIPDSPEPFWMGGLDMNKPLTGVWIDPGGGRALLPSGAAVDLEELYRRNSRSLTRASLEIFG